MRTGEIKTHALPGELYAVYPGRAGTVNAPGGQFVGIPLFGEGRKKGPRFRYCVCPSVPKGRDASGDKRN